jgi:hypothetical protein
MALAIVAAVLGIATADAQETEPRAYSNTPVGLNFLIAGSIYSEGKMAFDPDLAIADVKFNSNTGVLAYVRSFDLWGQSAKFDVIVPASSFSAHGLVDGQPREREMSGLGDPRFRVSVNLLGAPALSVKDFASYRQDLIVGVGLQVSAPLGQYDDSKLLNLGNNRWSFRPELGISKAWGPWTFEVAPSVTFFTDNTDLLLRKYLRAGTDLHRAGTCPLHFPVRRVVRPGRGLFLTRSHQPERREERQRAAQHAGRLHGRLADRPPQFAKTFRQHRHNDAHRQRIQRGRPRVAVPLGRPILRMPGRAG